MSRLAWLGANPPAIVVEFFILEFESEISEVGTGFVRFSRRLLSVTERREPLKTCA